MANFAAASYETLFRRCVTGCSQETPACPVCPDGQICSLVPLSCNACQSTVCVPSSTSGGAPATTSSSGPNVGGIAGGVIGGLFVIAAITYCIWRFCIKNKRQQFELEEWHDGNQAEKDEFTRRRDARASTHTVASIASTVLTRASNIIQIAYIPGITNRSAPSTPNALVPPVPPIPIALSSTSPRYEQEHFFMPGNLRDSTYSGVSDRTSYAARNSVASTIYGKGAIVSSVPAQTVTRAKAAVVSVKSNGALNGTLTPPVPSIDYNKYTGNGPPSPAFSVGSTFLNSASAATPMRPQVVRVGSSGKESAVAELEGSPRSIPIEMAGIPIANDTSSLNQGPFEDPAHPSGSSSGDISIVISEATTDHPVDPEIAELSSSPLERKPADKTPFGDENEVKE